MTRYQNLLSRWYCLIVLGVCSEWTASATFGAPEVHQAQNIYTEAQSPPAQTQIETATDAVVNIPDADRSISIWAQYRTPRGGSSEFNNFELYLRNTTKQPLSLKEPRFNGNPISSAKFDEVTWWQFYPSNQIPPGQTVVLQINARDKGVLSEVDTEEGRLDSYTVVVDATNGWSKTVGLPRSKGFLSPIRAITYSHDLSKIFVQIRPTPEPPRALSINGSTVTPIAKLTSAIKEENEVWVVVPDKPLHQGDTLHFSMIDRRDRRFDVLVRVLQGIVIDSYGVTDQAARNLLELDANPAAQVLNALGGDVACYDASHTLGSAAAAIVKDRLETYKKTPGILFGPHFCTAMANATIPIYGTIGDVGFANPYRLHYSSHPADWLGIELPYFRLRKVAVAPRPILYIPESFVLSNRLLEPLELEAAVWCTFAQGSKGVRYFIYDYLTMGFKQSPELTAKVQDLNQKIRKFTPLLAPLIVHTEQIARTAGEGKFDVVQSWAGDLGLVVLIVNRGNVSSKEPNFPKGPSRLTLHPIDSINVPIDIPTWFSPGVNNPPVFDLLTGEKISTVSSTDRIGFKATLSLPGMFRLLYIPADGKFPDAFR